ncbi:RDD family protein [Rosistilla ulvae]|uniref:RDD family protein n=1 Tax=Rosistilla ulvae TaxID=1930277 RepID=A0A517M4J5_9BACT|nr:RDD family protein [Rosistilla ulvae]QDS89794.1 RDD family protein [Rosistilla ulvae]
MFQSAPLDTTIEVVTPENIAFKYQLAGPFRRLPAFLIDLVIKFLIILLAILAVTLFAGLTGSQLAGIAGFAAINVGWFLVWWFYGVAMETWFNGRTVGKMAMRIRVVTVSGHPIGGVHAMLRNLICVADLAPPVSLQFFAADAPPVYMIPTGIVALVVMICTRRMQRLGDLAAGTMVVIDERGWQLPVAHVDDTRVPALASFIPPDYRVSPSLAKVLALYAERRLFLSPQRRRELATPLALPLAERFEFREDLDHDLLLYALYWRTYLADGRNQDVDLQPLAGYSPLQKDAQWVPAESVASDATPSVDALPIDATPIADQDPSTPQDSTP